MKENSLFPNLLSQTKFVYLLHDLKTMLRANVVEEVIPKNILHHWLGILFTPKLFGYSENLRCFWCSMLCNGWYDFRLSRWHF